MSFHVSEQMDIPNSVPFPIRVPLKLLRILFSTSVQQVGVRTHFFQDEPLDLQCLTMIWAIYVVEDVSINVITLTLEF